MLLLGIAVRSTIEDSDTRGGATGTMFRIECAGNAHMIVLEGLTECSGRIGPQTTPCSSFPVRSACVGLTRMWSLVLV
ncbi:hypothetical protein K523DRAFT_160960 [Schizophyllum commune Tattone D]|nr:hypothetical protein K523DRAFT_160960 [Schizophyllum commune Tattone D]